jgi:hypothetical protein
MTCMVLDRQKTRTANVWQRTSIFQSIKSTPLVEAKISRKVNLPGEISI